MDHYKTKQKKKSMFTFKYKERTLETITHAFLEEVQEPWKKLASSTNYTD